MYFELIIYSRLSAEILLPILEFIEAREGNVFSLKLDKSYCIQQGSTFCKSVEILSKNRDVSNILFVDSVFKEHIEHIYNFVPLSPYTGPSSTDFELIKLQKFLKKAAVCPAAVCDTIKTKLAQILL